MSIERCTTCNEMLFMPNHKCAPAFECRRADGYSDDWEKVYTNSDEGKAAELYLEKHFSRWECPMYGMEIEVRQPHAKTARVYTVEVQAVPEFSAGRHFREITIDDKEASK